MPIHHTGPGAGGAVSALRIRPALLVLLAAAGSAFVQSRSGHTAPLHAIGFVDGGRQLLSFGATGTVLSWDVARRDLVARRDVPALANALVREAGRNFKREFSSGNAL
jgi:hypothetical protein